MEPLTLSINKSDWMILYIYMKPVAIIASNKDKNFTNWQINFVNRPFGYENERRRVYWMARAKEERFWHGKTIRRMESRVPGTRIERKTCAEP